MIFIIAIRKFAKASHDMKQTELNVCACVCLSAELRDRERERERKKKLVLGSEVLVNMLISLLQIRPVRNPMTLLSTQGTAWVWLSQVSAQTKQIFLMIISKPVYWCIVPLLIILSCLYIQILLWYFIIRFKKVYQEYIILQQHVNHESCPKRLAELC